MKTTYMIKSGGRVETASSLRRAKAIANSMSRPVVGATSNMMASGVMLPAPRLYWQEWCDGSIVGDPDRNYKGDNPMVVIQVL